MTTQFSIGDRQYVAEPMNLFDQFDVTRRLAPVLALLALQKDKDKLEEGFGRAFATVTGGLDRADTEAVLRICLGCIKRNEKGAALQPIMQGGQLAYDDFDMSTMLKMVWKVLSANRIIDFFDVPPSK